MTLRDGHIRVLPLHVANKIAAGEVVERPASVAKELVENALDAGAKHIHLSIVQGGRKLVAVQDDGSGMTKDDAILSLERQATSKILDVGDIEEIDTLGFRGEAIPSIASVSRLSITTRRADSDEGTFLQVNAGVLAEVRAAGCPPGTLVEVRDLFCNVPARRKFLRSYPTEESHVRQVFTVHALAHPNVGFSLTVDGRELYKLAPAAELPDRIRDLFGDEFLANALPVGDTQTLKRSTQTIKQSNNQTIHISGFIERPNLSTPTRRDQYVFVNGRPATAPSIAYALREAYPRRAGDVRPAAILLIDLPPKDVDVNVHPTKREVRFRDNAAVKNAVIEAVENALVSKTPEDDGKGRLPDVPQAPHNEPPFQADCGTIGGRPLPVPTIQQPDTPAPVPLEFALEPEARGAKPWKWFKFLAATESGYLLIETDAGVVTINPHAARERIVYERMLAAAETAAPVSQALLIPETLQLPPVDAARLKAALGDIRKMGFQLEEFGRDTFKVDAMPQAIGGADAAALLTTIARDLGEGAGRRGGARWREELIAKSIAKSFAGANVRLTAEGAERLVEELCSTRMPYVCPRGKPVMIFTSTRELDRKFDRI